MAAFRFDDPRDDRRFLEGGDDQINGVGDVISRDLPSWIDRVKAYYEDFPVFGSICEGHEYVWRVIGTENVLLWLGLYPDELGAFVRRVGEFLVESTKAQIEAAQGMLAGMVIWGDVAYRNGMLFSPAMWRENFKPIVAEQIKACHDAGIPVIYHGCGNASEIYEDFIELGLDAYNPLEAQVMRKLNAAKGGGYLPQSDHSVPSNVSAERYEFVLDLLRKHGTYPLSLGDWDDPTVSGSRP